MKTAVSSSLTPPPRQGIAQQQLVLKRDAARDLTTAAALVLLFAVALAALADLGIDYAAKAVLACAAGAALIWRGLSAHPHLRFGPANRVTLARLGCVMLMAALLGESVLGDPLQATPVSAWCFVAVATVTALLDAVDGALARRTGLASAFGARFDMETDAAFILVLCLLVVQTGQAGLWILASGLMRHAFVAAAFVWPWLGAPLQPSKRRQTVCVIQVATLIACLAPIVPPQLASGLAAISLMVLTLSFATDVQTLARQRPTSTEI